MEFLTKITGGYDMLWKAFIRPPRQDYSMDDLGEHEFLIQNTRITRTDLVVHNSRGLALQCSHYVPEIEGGQPPKLPCVIYCHGNSGSRLDASQLLDYILPLGISLFCFDFAGTGRSDGEYISLGWHERDDVKAVIEYLRRSGKVSLIGLWGRSMGAVTSILYTERDPFIAGMVLDSPFASLKELAIELGRENVRVPSFLLAGALNIVS